jgi:molybdate/tungstate transport system ATP-binding protein
MIKIEKLRIELPGFTLENISLSIQDGEFFALLGPTGAGKTLILEAIAGVTPITSGRIRVEGRDVTRLNPEQRGIGIVYQDYALFPHLSVYENVTYGLRYHNTDPEASEKWVGWLMEQLGLQSLANRSIQHLSGGEKQRVSLARALAVNPSVLLLDEPLSALDPNFREDIRDILKKLHQEVGITFLMVTHDFAEALFLGDRTAILNRGKIEQVGTVADVFEHPVTPFVAEFVGMKNVFPATFDDARCVVGDLSLALETPPGIAEGHLAIRPEDLIVRKDAFSENGMTVLKGKVLGVVDRGPYHEVLIKRGEVTFTAMISKSDLFGLALSKNNDVHIGIQTSSIHVF